MMIRESFTAPISRFGNVRVFFPGKVISYTPGSIVCNYMLYLVAVNTQPYSHFFTLPF